MNDLDEIYTREWYRFDFEGLQPEFDLVGDAIARAFPGVEYSVDAGCGPGMLVRRLAHRGLMTWGFEGSTHALDYAREFAPETNWSALIAHADLRSLSTLNHFHNEHRRPELVICTEVLEHVEVQHAERVVQLLCSPMAPVVVTAAPPGQDGHHHVNCQPPAYWISLFEAQGAFYDGDLTNEMARRWSGLKRLSHMVRNVMVFR
jgi:2-polyprenyl-3-methyl-5-hydroxy-6-metoxy-1,4-benzoquinol methylase